jgi:hypothetical protein
VSATSRYDEERLGELLSLLPPAPAGWVEAAQELPAARISMEGAGLDEIVERVDAGFRAAVAADLEAALAAAGHEPTQELVEALRACLADLDR